ncbi:hypothetical protein HanIR_Chr12g0593431 [Helianthus annuus]|nr:hypothetical protein HanIR_Chr12g0593431 [Helianthus annuus]
MNLKLLSNLFCSFFYVCSCFLAGECIARGSSSSPHPPLFALQIQMKNPKLLPFIHTSLFSSSPLVYNYNHHRSLRFLSHSLVLQNPNPPLPFSVFGFHRSLYLEPNIPQALIFPLQIVPLMMVLFYRIVFGFGDDIKIFAFNIYPKGRGCIYVRLDRLCNQFLSMEDIQSYSHEYKKKLDEAGAVGDIPSDLAIEVSSPDADRLLRIPDDLQRFKNMAMRVKYADSKSMKKEGIFFLESIEMDSGSCVWRLADVKENRHPSAKGRPLTRKQKDWRLKLPYEMLEQVTLYIPLRGV